MVSRSLFIWTGPPAAAGLGGRAAPSSGSTPSSSAASFRAAPMATAYSRRRCRSDGDTSPRRRARDLPLLHVRRGDGLLVHPVPGQRRAATALPLRPAADVPAGERSGGQGHPAREVALG